MKIGLSTRDHKLLKKQQDLTEKTRDIKSGYKLNKKSLAFINMKIKQYPTQQSLITTT